MAPFWRPIERSRVARKSRLSAGPLHHRLVGGQEPELAVEFRSIVGSRTASTTSWIASITSSD